MSNTPNTDGYLNSKIEEATETWKGVDTDEFMNELRGDTLEDQARELAETILVLPDDTNIAYHTYRKGDYYLCDVETLQSIVREWKAYREMMATVKESHKEACPEPEWCVNCVVCYAQQRVDEACAALKEMERE